MTSFLLIHTSQSHHGRRRGTQFRCTPLTVHRPPLPSYLVTHHLDHRYILCIRVLIPPACFLLYSLLSFVISVPPTFPHPFSGTTTQVQLSCAPRSSANVTMDRAALVGSGDVRARSTISWSVMVDVRPSVTRITYAWAEPVRS